MLAEHGDVYEFIRSLEIPLEGDPEVCWILERTLKVFQATRRGLFNAIEDDELVCAYYEVMSLRLGEPIHDVAYCAATPQVMRWANMLPDVESQYELLKLAYTVKCLLRKQID